MAVRIIEPQVDGEIKTVYNDINDMSSLEIERLLSNINHSVEPTISDNGAKKGVKYGSDSSGFTYRIDIKSTF